MRKMKYIILDGQLNDLPFLFPPEISHEQMALMIEHLGPAISAGFVDLVDGEVSAWGESESLELGSRPVDSEIIARYM